MKRRNLAKATIMLASTLTVMAGGAITPATPVMKEAFSDFEGAEFLTKLIVSLPALFIAVGSPIVGQLIDRHGRLRILYFGLVLYAVAGVSGYFLANPYTILVTRAFLGLGVACIMPVAVALIGDYFEGKERETMTALQGAAMALGGVIFIGFAGVLADIHWQMPFLVYLFSLVVLGFCIVSLEEPVLPERDRVKRGYFEGLSATHYFLLASGLATMLFFYMLPIQVPYLLKGMGVNEMKMIGLALVTNTAASILVAANYKFFRRFLSFPAVNGFLFLLMATGYVVIYTAQSYGTVVVGLGMAGVGLGLFMPNFSLWILEITPARIRGRALGLVSSAIFLGQFLSPYFVQPILDAGATISEAFAMAAVCLVIMSGLFWIMAWRRRGTQGGSGA